MGRRADRFVLPFFTYSRGARHVREPRGGGGQAKKREIRRLFGRLTFYKKNGILTALNIERGSAAGNSGGAQG